MDASIPPVSKKGFWTGRIITGLVVLFFLFDGGTKLAQPAPVLSQMLKLGFTGPAITALGVILVVCSIAYAIPRTAVLAAIILTGYLGGAVDTNLRGGAPFFAVTLAPVYVGVLVWGGLFFRDPRVRRLIPFSGPV